MTSSAAAPPWPAPAKLNLMLHIVGRRADGYHLLQSAFQFIDLCDELRLGVRGDGRITLRGGLPGLDPADDLCVRAARALQTRAPIGAGVDIALDKRIPDGGGLGGGSSDAATVLVALNQLWACGLDTDALARMGLKLGADVPVFVHGHAAWAEGVGERLTPIDPPEPWYLLLQPGVHVSTATVFADPELTRDSPVTTIRDFLSGGGRNDCLPVVRGRYPEVAQAMADLEQFAPARLTGTGACVFAQFGNEAEARAAADALSSEWRTIVVKGLNRSPLLARLDRDH